MSKLRRSKKSSIKLLRIDPTRSISLRRGFSTKLNKQFALLKGQLIKLIVQEDALGLKQRQEVLHNCRPGQIRGANGLCGPGIGLGLSREQMPQIQGEHLERFTNYVRSHGVSITSESVSANDLSPIQKEFRQSRVDAISDDALRTPILVSIDYYVLDGTHRWIKLWQRGKKTPVPILKIGLLVEDALELMRGFAGVKFTSNSVGNWTAAGNAIRHDGGAMPGYGQIWFNDETGQAWYVGGDGDERGFDKKVEEILLELPYVKSVRYESEVSPRKEPGWKLVYNSERAWPTNDFEWYVFNAETDRRMWDAVWGDYVTHGGPGSGNFGHEGRPGQVGGSGGGDGGASTREEAHDKISAIAPDLFPNARATPTFGGYTFSLPGGRTVDLTIVQRQDKFHAALDFSVEDLDTITDTYESVEAESLGMLRQLRSAVLQLRDSGFNIEFQPSDKRRAALYSKALAKMGLKRVSGKSSGMGTQVWNSLEPMTEKELVEYSKQHPDIELELVTHDGPGSTIKAKVYEAKSKKTKNVFNTRWSFNSDAEKIKAFQEWLKQQVGTFIQGRAEEELWESYIQSGFMKGAARSYDDAINSEKWVKDQPLDFYKGSKDQFLKTAFRQPETVEKAKLLAGRAFDELQDITSTMSVKMSRVLTDGLVQGKHPSAVARDLAKEVDISRYRAEVIARTEFIRAHAEGQLDSMKKLGVTEVGVMVEWSTAGDDKVCELCEPLEGIVLTIEEARGMLPRHPMCRCAWIPANVGEEDEDQLRDAEDIEDALDKSGLEADIDEERPTRNRRSDIIYVRNMFCATGPGGGVDPSCGKGDVGAVGSSSTYKGQPVKITHKVSKNFVMIRYTSGPKEGLSEKVRVDDLEKSSLSQPELETGEPRRFGQDKDEMHRWGVEHFKEWEQSLSPASKKAISQYQKTSDVNYYLRTGQTAGNLSENQTRDLVTKLDAAIEKSKMPEDVIVYRGVPDEAAVGWKVGAVIQDKGYVSTSLSEKQTKIYAVPTLHSTAAVMEIRVPKGSSGAYMGVNKRSPDMEVLLPRETKIRIVGKENGRYIGEIVPSTATNMSWIRQPRRDLIHTLNHRMLVSSSEESSSGEA